MTQVPQISRVSIEILGDIVGISNSLSRGKTNKLDPGFLFNLITKIDY